MKILDTVALRCDLPEQGLPTGLVGVIVEEWQPGIFEVEFADLNGHTYAFAAVAAKDLLPLHHSLGKAA
ncbi:MAG: DUF4926 domain-containing protein [Methylococcaceae bacterium]|nr:MAG: DUF4926 domain-containing protein [Methylococcaceae bacterium]